ncbi:MAG: SDR family NAD(P)-dependent oxidoreductase [Actinomycetota bacterium]
MTNNRPIALVTGATAGIGAAFAELLARENHDLVIVARDLPRLHTRAEEWRERYNIEVEVIQADLSRDEDIRRLELRLQNISRPIEVLINNAGFGINKSFTTSDVAEEIALLDVLVTAPMRLMHAVLPSMKDRNSGTIINVSSVAAWIAGGSYSAAKSYMTVLSESLHAELRGTNIAIHSLCPGFTRTEFHQRGKMKMGAVPDSLWLSAERVAEEAWKSARNGKAISVPGSRWKVISFITRFAPRPLVRKAGMNLRVKQRTK